MMKMKYTLVHFSKYVYALVSGQKTKKLTSLLSERRNVERLPCMII